MKRILSAFLLAISLAVLSQTGFVLPRAHAFEASLQSRVTIPEFHQVNANIYRGGRPEMTGLQQLKDLGVKTIIDIEDNSTAIRAEKGYAAQVGLRWYSNPMGSFSRPSDALVNDILSMLQNPDYYPVYIHCHHGQDRTGMIMGLYRVFTDKWTPAAAYEEMLKYNFHPSLFALDRYFRDRTGYKQ